MVSIKNDFCFAGFLSDAPDGKGFALSLRIPIRSRLLLALPEYFVFIWKTWVDGVTIACPSFVVFRLC